MAGEGSAGIRVASILALSLGPFLVMADIIAVMIVKHEVVLGFGAPGKVFPSILGLIGIFLWVAGMFFIIWAKRVRKGRFSSKARPIFLKGRKYFLCGNCGKRMDASSVDYHERLVCSCGKIFDVFQEGPWDMDDPISEEGASPSRAPRMPKGNARVPKKRPPRPSR